jgi:hypothetical protein
VKRLQRCAEIEGSEVASSFTTKWFMILRTPTEDENGEASRRTFSPGFVIPAHAGIQVCSAPN